jgi:hypothetical protein
MATVPAKPRRVSGCHLYHNVSIQKKVCRRATRLTDHSQSPIQQKAARPADIPGYFHPANFQKSSLDILKSLDARFTYTYKFSIVCIKTTNASGAFSTKALYLASLSFTQFFCFLRSVISIILPSMRTASPLHS